MPELTQEQKYYRAKRRLLIGLVIAAIIIIILVWRGCSNEKSANEAYAKIEKTLANVLSNDKRVREELKKSQAEVADQDSLIADLVADRDVMQGALIDKSDESEKYRKQWQAAKDKKDTAKILVACDSIVASNNNLHAWAQRAWRQAASIDSLRVAQINNYKNQVGILQAGYDSCFKAAKEIKAELPSIKPRNKWYLTGTGLRIGPLIGGGGGFTFVNKKGLIIGLKGVYTNQGPGGMIDVGLPLSFRRK